MKKKLFLILILPVLILVGAWFLRGVFATSNPNSWTNGLVGYWSFDGQYTTSTDGTKDVSNNGNWGSFNGGVKPVGGISGQALSFDGVDDYVKLESDEGLNLAANLTLEAWINYNGTGSTTIIDRREQCPASVRGWSQYHLSVSNSVINYNIDRTSNCSGGSGGDRYEGSSAVTANEWHHVAVTVIDNDNFSGGRTVKMYLDGNLESVTQTLDLGDSSSFSVDRNYNNFIGARSDVADYIYSSNGLIDEVRIYNRALSADEVKQHYERTRRNLVVNNPSGTPPVGWWKMDEATGATVRDYSVNGNTGTKYWMSTSTNYGLVDGKIGKALSFDGVDDYVDCGNGASLDMTTNNFTVETWIKRTANFSSVNRGFLSKKDLSVPADSNAGYVLGITKSEHALGAYVPIASLGDNTNFEVYTPTNSGDNATLNSWAHITFVYNFSAHSGQWYINGASVATTKTSLSNITSLTNGAQPLQIGNYSGYSYFPGLIDDVRIYNYARTADQIAADYQAGAYRTIVGTSVPSTWWTDGLVGYWSFDGQYTTSTYGTKDVSGNNNWGTFRGGVKPVAGISGQALSFDGTDDSVNFTSSALRPAIWSFECWYKTKGTGEILANWYDSDSPLLIGIWSENKVLLYGSAGVPATYRYFKGGSIQISDNNWHHIVVTMSGDTAADIVNATGYIDGRMMEVDSTGIGTALYSKITFNIGGSGTPGGWHFDGLIDEVRLYNRVLSADEAKQHYEQTRRNVGI